jgi:RHS repeat-associated protein
MNIQRKQQGALAMAVHSMLTRLAMAVLLIVLCGQSALAERTTIYYHNDALGSVVAASDASGQLLWRKEYAPFGQQLDSTAEDEKLAYTGKEHDDITGLTYFGARYYDPYLGRFMGVDPAGIDPGDPFTFNRYSYANNNPYRFIDPDGRQSRDASGMSEAEIEADVNTQARLRSIHENYLKPGSELAGTAVEEGYKTYVGAKLLGAMGGLLVTKLPKIRRFFRRNLIAHTGGKDPGANWIAHHGLPVELADDFKKLGIKNIHDPKWGIWTHVSMHTDKKWHNAYNAAWKKFLADDPTPQQIERQWKWQKFLIDSSKEVK